MIKFAKKTQKMYLILSNCICKKHEILLFVHYFIQLNINKKNEKLPPEYRKFTGELFIKDILTNIIEDYYEKRSVNNYNFESCIKDTSLLFIYIALSTTKKSNYILIKQLMK